MYDKEIMRGTETQKHKCLKFNNVPGTGTAARQQQQQQQSA